MGITGSIIVYVLIWWIIFFSVLPIGIQSNKEKFKERVDGVDVGAPNNPKIGKKFLIFVGHFHLKIKTNKKI